MSELTGMEAALVAAQAAFAADDVITDLPPGTPARRDRMRAIIAEVAAAFGVERMELTMALTRESTRGN